MKIQSTLIIILVSFSIPGIIGIGYWINNFVETELTKQVLEELEAISEIQKNRVEENIDKNFERLQGISSRTQLRISLDNYLINQEQTDKDFILRILNDAKSSINDIKDIYIVDNTGQTIISTATEQELFQNKDFSLGNSLNLIYFDKDSIGNPSLFLKGPLNLDGNFLANLIVKIKPETLNQVAEDYTGLGLTGETFLAKRDQDGNALFITSLRFDPDAQLNRIILKEQTEVPITQALLKNENQFKDTVDYRGAQVLSSTKYIQVADWGLAVKIDKDEAFSILNDIQFFIWIGVGLVSSGLVIFSVFFARYFSKPIQILENSTRKIGTNEYSFRNPKGSDEINKLALAIKVTHEKLKESFEKLDKTAKLATIGQMGASMAHDLKNPLTTISLSNYNIKKRFSDKFTESDHILFENSNKAITQITDYIEDVLSFVRIVPTKTEEFSVKSLINEVLSTLEVPSDINIIPPSNDGTLTFDKTQLKRILINLLQNAIEATTPKGEIKIELNENENKLKLEIQDSANKLTDEQLPKLFEPLYTTKTFGTGLGLPSVKNIVEKNHGTITVKTNPTRFILSFPKK